MTEYSRTLGMFGVHHEELLEWLRDLQHEHCVYGTRDGDGRTCDCKFGYRAGQSSGYHERSGCPELRQTIRSLEANEAKLRDVGALLPDEWHEAGGVLVRPSAIRAVLARSQAPQAPAEQEGHVLTDRFCKARSSDSSEWTTGRTCPICRAVPSVRPVTADDEGVR